MIQGGQRKIFMSNMILVIIYKTSKLQSSANINNTFSPTTAVVFLLEIFVYLLLINSAVYLNGTVHPVQPEANSLTRITVCGLCSTGNNDTFCFVKSACVKLNFFQELRK